MKDVEFIKQEHLDELELKKKLLSFGVDRSFLSSWVSEFRTRMQEAQQYLEAGFRNPHAVKNCSIYCNSLDEALRLKDSYMKLGMSEKEAEEWLGYFVGDAEFQKKLYEKGYPPVFTLATSIYVFRRGSFEETIEGIRKLAEKLGVSEEELLWELAFQAVYYSRFTMYKHERGTLLKSAKELGLKSLLLVDALEALENGLSVSLEDIKKLKDFYVSRLGMSEVEAEWWIAGEMRARKGKPTGFEPEVVKELRELGIRNPIDIYEISGLLLENKGMSSRQLVEWYRLGMWHYSENLEKVSFEKFNQLLEKSLCSNEELILWLSAEEKVEDWISAGVLDLKSYILLKDLGYTPDDVRAFLSRGSFEQLIELAYEGVKPQEVKERLEQKASEETKRGFRLKP